MTALEAARVLTEFCVLESVVSDALDNFRFQAAGICALGREKAGKAEWVDAAEAWAKASQDDHISAVKTLLLEALAG